MLASYKVSAANLRYLYSKVTKYIENQFYEDKYNQNIKQFKLSFQNIIIHDETMKVLDDILKEIHYFSLGIDIIKIGYKNFKHHNKKYFRKIKTFTKIKIKFLDFFTRNKEYSISSLFIKKTPKKDYLNKSNSIWMNNGIETNETFFDIYDKTKEKVAILLNLINENLYYNAKNDKQINKILNR